MLYRIPGTLLILSILLASCGGGGGGGSNTPPPPPAPNQAPVANAGPEQFVPELTEVILNGGGSNDSDGTIASYEWRQVQGLAVDITDADQESARFMAPDVNSGATLQFELQVTDNEGSTHTASTTVNVEPPAGTPRHSMAGTVTAGQGLAVDSDVNDQTANFQANDTPETAQLISNPVSLGGYVNVAGSGEPGRSTDTGDVDDYFQIELLEGQSITMLVADFNQADADLYLLDTEGNILDFSIETGEIESLVAPADGFYLLNVFAFSGATNYILAIGSNSAASTRAKPRFVPGQTILRYRNGTTTASTAPMDAIERLSRRVGMNRLAGDYSRTHLAGLKNVALDSSEMQTRLRAATAKANRFEDKTALVNWQTLMAIKSLRLEPEVLLAEPNYLVQANTNPNDDAFTSQWHYDLINLPAAWDLTVGSEDIVVAVVDTGILAGHPDLTNKSVAGYDFVRSISNSGDGDPIDPDPEDNGSSDVSSTGFHGTHVGGTVAASTDNRIGVAGVGWQTRIMPLRVLGVDGSGTTYDVRQAIRFAASLSNDSGTVPDRPADIINLSLGGGDFSQVMQDLFNEVRAAGVVVVAAAGNESSSLPHYPAAYDNVISVSAVDISSNLASYSNFGSTIDVAAPGGDSGSDVNGDGYPDAVLSTGGTSAETGSPDFAYVFQIGTSMASPHMAGVIALMKAVNPSLTPEDIDALLEIGELTEDLGDPGRDHRYGHGLINAQSAVAAALAASGNPPADNPRLNTSTSSLSFPGSISSRDFSLRNGGQGELEVLEVRSSASWLSVTPQNTDASGLGSYRASISREGLEPGVYRASITAHSAINDISLEVTASVAVSVSPGDVGFVYVLLIDATTREAAAQDQGNSAEGRYSYNFFDIPEGMYEIFAGTDTDADLTLCDPGEACSSYLTLDSPVQVQVNTDLEGLDFPIDFLIRLPTPNEGDSTSDAQKTLIKKRKPDQ